MTDTVPSEILWGTEVRRRQEGIPFLQYEPRRRSLPALLEDAHRWARRDHLVQGERRISFEKCLAAVDAVAADLRQRGIGPGSVVLLVAANSPEWVVSFWAVSRTGAIIAPGNGWWSEEEVDHVLGLIKPALVIGDPKRLAKVTDGGAVATLDVSEIRTLVDAARAGDSPAAPGGPAPNEVEEAPAVIVFTSGTTGFPKGATLPHRSVIANLHDLLAVAGRLPHQLDPERPGNVSLLTGPLFHIGGIQSMTMGLVGGNTLVFLEGRFDPVEVLDLIEREQVTIWGGVPTMARRVIEHPSMEGRDLSSLRSVSLGGAPVPPDLIGRLGEAFPNARRGVSTVYGMTEAGGTVAAAGGKLMAEHPGTSGRPGNMVDLRIADPDADGVGEVLVRTPGQMLGYWADGGASAATVDDDGFLHTGDLGRVEDGLLFITGRSKDVIIRGGENIAAPHVEAVLVEHPDVVEAGVVGLPHEDFGEEVAAAVILREGAELSDVEVHCRSRLAHFEVPTRWWIRTEALPTNDAGKLDKRTLRKMWPAGE